jgi:hypothetical protein
MGATAAAKNKKIRQEALREQLRSQGHVQHVVDNIVKIESLSIDNTGDGKEGVDYKKLQLSQHELARLKTATELRLKLINKYLPDLKAIDIEGEIDSSLTITRKSYKDIEG